MDSRAIDLLSDVTEWQRREAVRESSQYQARVETTRRSLTQEQGTFSSHLSELTRHSSTSEQLSGPLHHNEVRHRLQLARATSKNIRSTKAKLQTEEASLLTHVRVLLGIDAKAKRLGAMKHEQAAARTVRMEQDRDDDLGELAASAQALKRIRDLPDGDLTQATTTGIGSGSIPLNEGSNKGESSAFNNFPDRQSQSRDHRPGSDSDKPSESAGIQRDESARNAYSMNGPSAATEVASWVQGNKAGISLNYKTEDGTHYALRLLCENKSSGATGHQSGLIVEVGAHSDHGGNLSELNKKLAGALSRDGILVSSIRVSDLGSRAETSAPASLVKRT